MLVSLVIITVWSKFGLIIECKVGFYPITTLGFGPDLNRVIPIVYSLHNQLIFSDVSLFLKLTDAERKWKESCGGRLGCGDRLIKVSHL